MLAGVGCSDATSATPAPQEEPNTETGTLVLPLVIQVGESTYRLSMSLEIYGTNTWDYVYTDAFSEETSIQRALLTGDYNAYLYSWQMYKEEDGEIFEVASNLVSDSYSYFSIHNNATTTLSYTFETDGVRVTIGTGNLVVNVEVNEIAPACEPLSDSCGEGLWCPPTELTGKQLSCVWVEGTGELGDPCNSPNACGANLSCFDFGAGPVCGALCLAEDFDGACDSGGSCVAQAKNYGVCVPEGGAPPATTGGGGFGGSSEPPPFPSTSSSTTAAPPEVDSGTE